jgi:hypothetical protein
MKLQYRWLMAFAQALGPAQIGQRANNRIIWLLQIRRRSLAAPTRRQFVSNIFNSNGVQVAVVVGSEIFDLKGNKLYKLRGVNIYRLSGELLGHLTHAGGSDKRLDRFTDRLFSRAATPLPPLSEPY